MIVWSIRFYFCVFVTLCFFSLLRHGTGRKETKMDKQLNLKMEIEYQNNKKRVLKISLLNQGEDFDCLLADLPWSHWHSLNLIIVQKNGKQLPLQEYIDDPLVGARLLKKGQTIVGYVDLDQRFPLLGDTLSKNGVDIFWSFQLGDLEKRQSKRLGGFLYAEIEKK